MSLRTPAGVRTLDPLIKSQMLYQLSYKRLCKCYFSNACAKVVVLSQTAKFLMDFFIKYLIPMPSPIACTDFILLRMY